MKEIRVWPIRRMERAFQIGDQDIPEQIALALADRRIEFHFKPHDAMTAIFTLSDKPEDIQHFIEIYCDRLQYELMLREDTYFRPEVWREMKPLDTRPDVYIWEITGPEDAVLDTTAYLLQSDHAHPSSREGYLKLEYFEERADGSAVARLAKPIKRETAARKGE